MNEHGPNWNRYQAGLTRRAFLGRSLAVGAGSLGLGSLLQACGGDEGAPVNVTKKPPAYYPSTYQQIINASRKEGGELVIYSNLAEYNWAPIFEGFQAKYPWVEDISTNNLDSSEVFQRYYNEEATGRPAADMLVTASPQDWITFQKRGFAMDYQSPETGKLPDFAVPLPGVYTFSTDPILMAYNKAVLSKDKQPTGIGHLAQLMTQYPSEFRDKVTSYDATSAFGMDINLAFIDQTSGAWQKLETILPATRPESSSGPMVEKINSGEYVAGFFMSSTVVLPAVEDAGAILGWNYIDDGTPMFMRGMAISKQATRPNTSRLMLDFLLSEEGQTLIYEGGLTPYRPGLARKRVPRSYQSVGEEIGADKLVLIGYEAISSSTISQFKQRWTQLVGG